MIKKKDLVPGRVLFSVSEKLTPVFDINGFHIDTKLVKTELPCMVIYCYPDVKRRHSKSTAPVNGWDVLVMWIGDSKHKLITQVKISPDNHLWKRGW